MYKMLQSIYRLFNLSTISQALQDSNMSNNNQIEEVPIGNDTNTSVGGPPKEPAPQVPASENPKPKRNFGIQPTVFNRPNGKSYLFPTPIVSEIQVFQ
jgi:hypothetical protein